MTLETGFPADVEPIDEGAALPADEPVTSEGTEIGGWVMRQRRGIAHLVESVIAGDAITRCGRRLSDEPTSRGALIGADPDTRRCQQCAPDE